MERHLHQFILRFNSPERAADAISEVNSMFCRCLNLCMSTSCGCELGIGSNICKSYEVDGVRKVTINEGPEWTMIYLQEDSNLIMHLFYYGPKLELEWMDLQNNLAKFQYTEAMSERP